MQSINMENFSVIEQKMNRNYDSVTEIMGTLYANIQENPEDINSRDMLLALGEVAINIINTQIDFAYIYCDDSRYKGITIEKLKEKEEQLLVELNKTKQIERRR